MKDNIKNNLIEDFQLPKYVKGKSFSEASKAIDKKFKDRKDTFATKTKEELLERLAKAQEYVKMQDALKNQSQEIPDMMNGQIPPGMEEFVQPQGQQLQQMADGGIADGLTPIRPNTQLFADTSGLTSTPDTGLSSSTTNSGMSDGLASGIGAGLSAAGYALSSKDTGTIAGEAEHNKYIDTTKDIVAGVIGPIGGLFRGIQKGGQGLGNAIGGEVGAGMSDLFSPEESTASIFTTNKDASWDEKLALTMPIVGGIANKRLKERREHEERVKNTQIKNLQYDRDFAMGGYMDNKMMYGGFGAGETYPQPEEHPHYQYPNYFTLKESPVNEGLKSIKPDTGLRANAKMPIGYGQNIQPEKKNTFGKAAGKGLDWLGQNYGDIMSYAPAIGALTQKIDKPNTARGTRLDNRYERQLFDEAALQNSINQNNMQGALTNNSGGDLGALRTNLIAGNLAKTKALSDAYLRGNEINRNENRAAQQFNLNVDSQNMMQDERYIERKAQDEAAYSSAIADRRKAVLDNIGNIGREESNKKLVKQLFGYTWNGKYWVDSKGNQVSDEEAAKARKAIADAQKDNKKDKE